MVRDSVDAQRAAKPRRVKAHMNAKGRRADFKDATKVASVELSSQDALYAVGSCSRDESTKLGCKLL